MFKIDHSKLVDSKFLGIPFVSMGRSFDGVDCVGIVWLFLKENGIEVPDTDGLPVPRDWKKHDAERLINMVLKLGDLAPLKKLKKFDVILFTLSDSKRRVPDHIAVLISHSHFLHITENGISCVEGFNEFNVDRLSGAFRLHKTMELIPKGMDLQVKF